MACTILSIDIFEVPTVEEEELETITTQEYVQLKNVAFENDKWKFSIGENSFFAKIKDEDFLESVAKNNVYC